MKFCLSFICLLAFAIWNAAVAGQSKRTVYHIREGKRFVRNCPVSLLQVEHTFWVKDDGNSTFRQNMTTLYLKSINKTSAGDYTCYVNNITTGSRTVIDEITIDITQYPAEVTNFTVTPVKLSENDTLTVSCNFVGNPLPKYYLYRDTPNAWVLQSGLAKSSTISLTRSWAAKCVDTGTWCCQAQNDLNTPYSMRIQDIKVLCSPRPNTFQFNKNQYKVTAGLGDIASFSMSSVGYPYPNYTWSHNGEVLSDSMVQNYAWYSGVEIRNVSLADFGNYTLTMNNSLGIYEAVYELIPDDSVPSTPQTTTMLSSKAQSYRSSAEDSRSLSILGTVLATVLLTLIHT